MKRLAAMAGLIAAMAASAAAARDWSDSTGKYRVEAKFVAVKDEKVYLEKESGQVIQVPLQKLGTESLEYLYSLPEAKPYFDAHPRKNAAEKRAEKFAEIHVDDPKKVGEVRRFAKMGWSVRSLAFSPDGRFLAVGKLDRAIGIYDIDKNVRAASRENLNDLGEVTSLAFTPDGRKLLSGGHGGRIQMWNVSDSGQLTESGTFIGHAHDIHSIYVGANGNSVLSGDGSGTVRAWKLDTCREDFATDGYQRNLTACFLSRSAKQGLAADGERLDLIDMLKGQRIQSMPIGHSMAHACVISPDARYVAQSESYVIHVREIRTGKQLPLLQAEAIQWSLAFTSTGKCLLSGDRGKVNLWDIETGKKLQEFAAKANAYVKVIAASPDGIHFAAISNRVSDDLVVYRLPPEARK
jgi:hypothetical protein